MESAGGGIDGAAKTKKRISDCLADSDGGEDAAPPSPPSPGTPRLRIPMFTCARLRFVRLGRKGGRARKEAVAEKSEAASTDSSGTCRGFSAWSQFSLSASVMRSVVENFPCHCIAACVRVGWKQGSNGGAASTEAAGMGLSMLFLLAKTCVELNRMAEVRAQMETLLEEMRDLQLARATKTSADNHAASPGRVHDLPPSTTAASLCRCRCRASAGTCAGAASTSSSELSLPPRRFHRRRDDPSYALSGNPLFDLDRAAGSTSGMETASGESGTTTSEVEDPMSMSLDVAGAQFFELNNYNTEQETPEVCMIGFSLRFI
jgi:hypothetical protein